jgi:DNA polymerase I-like protein with 3'-5' exonuclease and polymerase domains
MASLELILLGHYLFPLDGGAFSERVCDPDRDPHTEHAELTGLDRHSTKTVTYAYVYGASAPRVGAELEITEEEIVPLLNYRGLPMLLNSLKRRDGENYREPDDIGKARLAKGRIVIKAFESKIEGIKDLKENVSKAAERGWLKGIDGAKLYVRKAHAALNTLLQGAGAIVCKMWMVETHRLLEAQGLRHGIDFKQVAWVHDELQFDHRPGLGDIIAKASDEAAKTVGRKLGLRGEFRTSTKTGPHWAATH